MRIAVGATVVVGTLIVASTMADLASGQQAACVPARVSRVVNGDTIEVEVDGEAHRVRYIGVDAPERDWPEYHSAATDLNLGLLEGESICLEPDENDKDPHGSLLRSRTALNALRSCHWIERHAPCVY